MAFAVDFFPIRLVDECGIEINNFLFRAIVCVEVDTGWLFTEEIQAPRFKLNEVLDRSSPKTIESLIVVANHADVLTLFCKFEIDLFLNGIGILILVDDDVFVGVF